MDTPKLFNSIQDNLKLLRIKNKEMQNYGMKKAEAEEVYRIALASFMAEKIMRGEKVSVLGDLARGDKEVASLRKNRDKWLVMYDTTLESIYALKLEIRMLETMLKLEYGNAD